MDTFLALELIALALTGLLIWHSACTRGAAFTWMFFLSGALLGLVRENVVAQVAALNLYSYNPATFHLWVGAAPLILMVFWSYTIYLALTFSEVICGGDLIGGKRRVWVILLSMVFMASYACLNEAFASIYPMVLWKFKPALTVWGGTPAMVLWGYAGMSLIFLLTLLPVYKLHIRTVYRVLIFCASVIVMIPLHLIWIGVFRLTTSAIG
ncbi:MAG: hypothetical protein WC566_04465 [Dehalococcoidia bacterium]